MSRDQVLHIITESSAERAEQARLGFELGYHAEIYSDVFEFERLIPDRGIIIARDDGEGTLAALFAALENAGRWLPVIATGCSPRPRRVVDAIKEGALDYISLPLAEGRLSAALRAIEQEAQPYCEARRRVVEARKRLTNLTPREREVLDWLAEGSSNKVIARELSISPRTVEIHRANMMAKLGASHSAEAVRVCLEARMAVVLGSPLSFGPFGASSAADHGAGHMQSTPPYEPRLYA